jgi:tetratricopeptide (TPR) repeat protein
MDWLRRRFRSPAPVEAPPAQPPAVRHLAAARSSLHGGDAREALRQISLGIEADPSYVPLYKLVATAYALLPTGQSDWRLFATVGERPTDPEALHALGRYFIGTPTHRTAIPLLERALTLASAPGNVPIACTLAEALLGEGRPQEARDRLRAVELADDPRARLLLEEARFLAGETDGLPAYVTSERTRLNERLAGVEGEAREEAVGMLERLDRLEEALARRAVVPDPDGSLRAWHFIQYGAAVLHVAGDGGSSGRFGAVAPTIEDVGGIAARLVRLLTATDRMPELIVSLPDADSLRVAGEISQAAGVPLESLPSPLANRSTRQMIEDVERERVLLARERSLVVAADNRALERIPSFGTVLPGQTVFAFAHQWSIGASLTPDVSGLLCRACHYPWTAPVNTPAAPGPRNRLSSPEPEQPAVPRKKEPPPASADVPNDPPAFDTALAFYQDRASQLKGGAEGGNRRWKFRRDTAVAVDPAG